MNTPLKITAALGMLGLLSSGCAAGYADDGYYYDEPYDGNESSWDSGPYNSGDTYVGGDGDFVYVETEDGSWFSD